MIFAGAGLVCLPRVWRRLPLRGRPFCALAGHPECRVPAKPCALAVNPARWHHDRFGRARSLRSVSDDGDRVLPNTVVSEQDSSLCGDLKKHHTRLDIYGAK